MRVRQSASGRHAVDKVALTGSIIGLVSLLTGWLTLKPNRLAQGASLDLWGSFEWGGAAIIIALWLLCLALSLTQDGKHRAVILGLAGNAMVAAVFLLLGPASRRLLEGQPDVARVSLSSGFWLALGGAYAAVFTARQRLAGHAFWRETVSWMAAAVFVVLLASGWFDSLSVVHEFLGNRARFGQELVNHLVLFGVSTVIATAIAVPLGIWATRSRSAEKPVFYITNIVQTVPSLALFGFLIAPLSALSFAFPVLREAGIRGVGDTPAVIALVVYSLLPVVRNTYVGIKQVEPAITDAGRGMGMGKWQVLRRVELPLAAPLILEGIRTAAVQGVGLTTVAALIGAGGLGWFVFQGIGQAAPDLILLGALPVLAMALAVDTLMRLAVRMGTPRALRGEAA
jgi:osmoprotectant transport system permease protein